VVATGKVSSQTKAVILAAFTVTDELLRLRKEKETLSKRVEAMLDLAQKMGTEPDFSSQVI
jgi:hypothetical protein